MLQVKEAPDVLIAKNMCATVTVNSDGSRNVTIMQDGTVVVIIHLPKSEIVKVER